MKEEARDGNCCESKDPVGRDADDSLQHEFGCEVTEDVEGKQLYPHQSEEMKFFDHRPIKEFIVFLELSPVEKDHNQDVKPNKCRGKGNHRLNVLIVLKEGRDDGVPDSELSESRTLPSSFAVVCVVPYMIV
jgi:hypothetical protein